MTDVQETIENRLATAEPGVEVILVEALGGARIRLFIDHPQGVDLGLCERVTHELSDLLDEYSLEVSSPGLDRPLTKPEHYRRYVGCQVRVRTREAVEGRRNFMGTLKGADETAVSVQAEDGDVTIPHERIHRSNLVPDPTPGGSR